jgi:hypothetical protein
MKNYKLTILFLLFLTVSNIAQVKNETIKLFPVFVDGKYGYINFKGEMVIQPEFTRANGFHDGLALVEIDSKNISDIPGHYDYVMGKQGYIDRTGKFIIPPGKYYLANDFSEGLAGVGINNCQKKYCYGYIDITGKVVIEPQFQTVSEFHNGTAGVRMSNDRWGIINKDGKFIIPAIYDAAMPFVEDIGIGMVIKNKKELPFNQKISDFEAVFYNREGKIISRPRYFVYGAFTDGVALILTETGHGFIDKTGKIVIEPKYKKALYFSEGLCPVMLNGNWGYIDKTGKIIIEPKFMQAFMFSDGLAKVLINGKYGFIDKTGKIIIEPQTWDVGNFEDGLAFVRQQSTTGYINKSGQFIWKTKDN